MGPLLGVWVLLFSLVLGEDSFVEEPSTLRHKINLVPFIHSRTFAFQNLSLVFTEEYKNLCSDNTWPTTLMSSVPAGLVMSGDGHGCFIETIAKIATDHGFVILLPLARLYPQGKSPLTAWLSYEFTRLPIYELPEEKDEPTVFQWTHLTIEPGENSYESSEFIDRVWAMAIILGFTALIKIQHTFKFMTYMWHNIQRQADSSALRLERKTLKWLIAIEITGSLCTIAVCANGLGLLGFMNYPTSKLLQLGITLFQGVGTFKIALLTTRCIGKFESAHCCVSRPAIGLVTPLNAVYTMFLLVIVGSSSFSAMFIVPQMYDAILFPVLTSIYNCICAAYFIYLWRRIQTGCYSKNRPFALACRRLSYCIRNMSVVAGLLLLQSLLWMVVLLLSLLVIDVTLAMALSWLATTIIGLIQLRSFDFFIQDK